MAADGPGCQSRTADVGILGRDESSLGEQVWREKVANLDFKMCSRQLLDDAIIVTGFVDLEFKINCAIVWPIKQLTFSFEPQPKPFAI